MSLKTVSTTSNYEDVYTMKDLHNERKVTLVLQSSSRDDEFRS